MSKYKALAAWLSGYPEPHLALSLHQIEERLEFALPESARKHQAYWASNVVGAELFRVGWRAVLRPAVGQVQFSRMLSARLAAPPRPIPPVHSGSRPDLVLVGCVSTKIPGSHRARDLYTSALFLGRRAYAEASGVPWFILSAYYGLIAPDREVESYNLSLLNLSATDRNAWSKGVLEAIDRDYGSVDGHTVEIHAGAEYRESGLESGLRQRGARVQVPLRGLRIGEQTAWYTRPPTFMAAPPTPPTAEFSAVLPEDSGQPVAQRLSREFFEGTLDLSVRPGAPPPGWHSMPECRAIASIGRLGASPATMRTFLTLVAAMDRARDADRLWDCAVRLYQQEPWVFQPALATVRSLRELRDALARYRVSQRHGSDSAAWRLILEALGDPEAPEAVHRVIEGGTGDARDLPQSVCLSTPAGQSWFPYLGSPKVSVMWVRMLADPGGATISSLSVLPVAVDVQVRKVSEYLGITNTGDRPLETVRDTIQARGDAYPRKLSDHPP